MLDTEIFSQFSAIFSCSADDTTSNYHWKENQLTILPIKSVNGVGEQQRPGDPPQEALERTLKNLCEYSKTDEKIENSQKNFRH